MFNRLQLLSGRLDSNQRPLGPEPSALAELSYAPGFPITVLKDKKMIYKFKLTH